MKINSIVKTPLKPTFGLESDEKKTLSPYNIQEENLEENNN